MAPPTKTSRKKLFNDQDVVVVVDDDDDDTKDTTSRKRPSSSGAGQTMMDRFRSPTKKNKTTVAVVTPDTTKVPKEQHKKNDTQPPTYVPTYIHKNLEYKRASQTKHLDSVTATVYSWIQEHCTIPSDFETNRAFGPLSGSCHEERVLRAYRLGLLETSSSSSEIMCTACATLGHHQNQCPSLI